MSKKEVKKDPLLDEEQEIKQPEKEAVKPLEKKDDVAPVNKAVATPPLSSTTTVQAAKDIVKETKDILDKSPHVNFIVPLAEGEAPGSRESVQINGYRIALEKGVMVNIPVAIANIIAEKYRINMEVGKDKRLDQASEKTREALS